MGGGAVPGFKSWSSSLSKQAINWHINSRDQLTSVIRKKVPWGTARAPLVSFHKGSRSPVHRSTRAPDVRALARGAVLGVPPCVPTRVRRRRRLRPPERGGCKAHARGPWMGEIPPPKV